MKPKYKRMPLSGRLHRNLHSCPYCRGKFNKSQEKWVLIGEFIRLECPYCHSPFKAAGYSRGKKKIFERLKMEKKKLEGG
jgi:uncharacterized CHY-type Zn-finger protein